MPTNHPSGNPKAVKEATVTAKIVKGLNALPSTYVRKVHGGRYGAGWPDIIGTCHGKTLALEVKSPTTSYKVTPLQAAELAKWQAAGAVAGVVTSLAQVVELMELCPMLSTTGAVRQARASLR